MHLKKVNDVGYQIVVLLKLGNCILVMMVSIWVLKKTDL